jgi:hypothetical protein
MATFRDTAAVTVRPRGPPGASRVATRPTAAFRGVAAPLWTLVTAKATRPLTVTRMRCTWARKHALRAKKACSLGNSQGRGSDISWSVERGWGGGGRRVCEGKGGGGRRAVVRVDGGQGVHGDPQQLSTQMPHAQTRTRTLTMTTAVVGGVAALGPFPSPADPSPAKASLPPKSRRKVASLEPAHSNPRELVPETIMGALHRPNTARGAHGGSCHVDVGQSVGNNGACGGEGREAEGWGGGIREATHQRRSPPQTGPWPPRRGCPRLPKGQVVGGEAGGFRRTESA